MIWEWCSMCKYNGNCQNQDRGDECECYGKKKSEENERLKQLLLCCKPYLSEWTVPMDILAEIDELEEK